MIRLLFKIQVKFHITGLLMYKRNVFAVNNFLKEFFWGLKESWDKIQKKRADIVDVYITKIINIYLGYTGL